MDYDRTAMPAAYDHGRSYAPQVLKLWLTTISENLPDRDFKRIVDLGCGTGRYSSALADHFGADVRAFDPSEKMLEQARRKQHPRVQYQRSAGERLPLDDQSVDLVFMSMVFHHFDDPEKVARECHRVLRPGGCACLRAGSREQISSYPQVRFFERTTSILEEMMQPGSAIVGTFSHADLHCLSHVLVKSEAAASWKEFADKVSYRADSVLSQLSDEEFRAGLEKLRSYAQTQPDETPVVEIVDFFVFQRYESPNSASAGAA